jgi:hypothetical protein
MVVAAVGSSDMALLLEDVTDESDERALFLPWLARGEFASLFDGAGETAGDGRGFISGRGCGRKESTRRVYHRRPYLGAGFKVIDAAVIVESVSTTTMNSLPPSLLYFVIYNPTLKPSQPLGEDDEDAEEQAHVLFYTAKEHAVSRDRVLRQVGLAKAVVNFTS